MMYVDPGDLNKKIQIVQKSEGAYDDEGHLIAKETVIRTCWARVSNVSGTEMIRAAAEIADAKRRFLVRYTSTEITTAMVVRYKGLDHNILYVNTYGDNKEYTEIWTDTKEKVI